MRVTPNVSQQRPRPTADRASKVCHTRADKAVLLVHDDPHARAALERTLQRGGVRTATAASAQEAVATLEGPDAVAIGVVICDYALADVNGVELLRRVRRRWPRIARILLLPGEAELRIAARAVNEARVAGLVLTPYVPRELLDLSRQACATAAAEQVPVAGAAEAHTGQRPDGDSVSAGQARLGRLTAREREVLACLGRGANNAEIAEQLHLTLGSARVYVKRVLTKLGVRDRTKAALEARTLGLGLGAERG